jgi:hypothetical protein
MQTGAILNFYYISCGLDVTGGLTEPSVSAHDPLTDASSEVGGRRGK